MEECVVIVFCLLDYVIFISKEIWVFLCKFVLFFCSDCCVVIGVDLYKVGFYGDSVVGY